MKKHSPLVLTNLSEALEHLKHEEGYLDKEQGWGAGVKTGCILQIGRDVRKQGLAARGRQGGKSGKDRCQRFCTLC